MHQCPRCQATLKTGEHDHFCPNHHGALLTLKEFEHETNRGFTHWFYASWLRVGNKRTISCPDCASKMVQLKQLFYKHVTADKVRDLSSEQHEALGRILIQNDQITSRLKRIEKLGRIFTRKHYEVRPGLFKRGSWFSSDDKK